MEKVLQTLSQSPSIPSGWKVQKVVRKKGITAGKVDTYVTTPGGTLFRSKKALSEFILKKKLPYSVDSFYQTLENNSHNNTEMDRVKNLNVLSSSTLDFSKSDVSFNIAAVTLSNLNEEVVNSTTIAASIDKEDISKSLLESQWVTDDAVQVCFDVLNHLSLQLQDVHFLNPVVSLAIKVSKDFKDIMKPLSLQEKNFVFIPVNDSSEIQSKMGSGSH